MADKANGPAHTGLKLALAFALVLAAGVGLALGLTDRTSAQQARPQGAPAADPGHHRSQSPSGCAAVFQRPGHGAGIQLRAGAQPRRWHADAGAGHRGPGGEGRRHPRGDRSAPVSGGARRGAGEANPGRGGPQQREARPGAVYVAGAEQLRLAPAGRYPAGHGQPPDRDDRRRRCGDRDGAAEPRLLHHHLAVPGTCRPAPGRSGQHGARRGRDRDHDDHPDPSDLGAVHPAAGHPAAHQPGDGCREAAGDRLAT